MAFRVQLTDGAAGDLEEICNYIERQDSPARANQVLDRIEEAFQGLSERPQRGRYPRELLDIGISGLPGSFLQALQYCLPSDREDRLRARHR